MVALARPHLPADRPGWRPWSAGLSVAAVVTLLPGPWLHAAAQALGAAVLAGSSTDLTLRLAAALGGGALAAIATWAALRLFGGDRQLFPSQPGAPVLRRADAHPDAPARRPLSAAELAGPPFDPEARATGDLDTPRTIVDAPAVAALPPPPLRAVAALAPGERLETFRLARPPVAHPAAPEAPGIDALLSRLEKADRRPA